MLLNYNIRILHSWENYNMVFIMMNVRVLLRKKSMPSRAFRDCKGYDKPGRVLGQGRMGQGQGMDSPTRDL